MSYRARKCGCDSPAAKAVNAARGLAKITAAELRGRINPPAYRKAFEAMCQSCPSSQRHAGVLWCGEPLVDATDHPDPAQRTCGCVCREKARIKGETCPQDKHLTLTVEGR